MSYPNDGGAGPSGGGSEEERARVALQQQQQQQQQPPLVVGVPYPPGTAPALTPEQFNELYGAQLRQQREQFAYHAAHAAAMTPAAAAQNAKLKEFWREQLREMGEVTDFKTHLLPLARIKKIMKSDEDVRMISSEAPVLFAKACEMFISELTTRAWSHAQEKKRRTLQRSDVAAAITKTDIFDFLIDIVPRDDFKDAASAGAGPAPSGLPPPGHAVPAQATFPPSSGAPTDAADAAAAVNPEDIFPHSS